MDEVKPGDIQPVAVKPEPVETEKVLPGNLQKKIGFGLFILLIVGMVSIGLVYFPKIISKNKTVNLTPVTVSLKWLHQAQFAGLYVAENSGLYKTNGIKATFVPFDYKNFPIDEVLAGRAQFGVAGADEILIAREKGKKVKALAIIFQNNPVVIYTLEKNGITSLAQLQGKRLGLENSENIKTIASAILSSQKMDINKDVVPVTISFDATQLLNGDVDAATGYSTNEPLQAEAAGEKVVVFQPQDYGVKAYADVLFTSEEVIKNQPDLVKKFVSATLSGWDNAISAPDEAVKAVLSYPDSRNLAQTQDAQTKQLEKTIPLIKPYPDFQIGSMSYETWQSTYEILKRYKMITKDLTVRDAYTTEFLN